MHSDQPSSSLTNSTVPWQLWVVIALLGVEGIGNALHMFANPVAATWPAAKILSAIGFIRRWRPVYVYFLIVSAIHVIGFVPRAPVIALINLVLLLLVASQYYWFFPKRVTLSVVANNQVL